MMNPKSTTISSIGDVITEDAKQLAQFVINETIEYLPADSLAMKIIKEGRWPFSEKQLWVVAYELCKNPEYVAKIEEEAKYAELREESRKARSNAKHREKRAYSKKVAETKAMNDANNSSMNIGDEVSHAQFGNGIVSAMDASTITVNFNGTEKRLMKQFAKLTKI